MQMKWTCVCQVENVEKESVEIEIKQYKTNAPIV